MTKLKAYSFPVDFHSLVRSTPDLPSLQQEILSSPEVVTALDHLRQESNVVQVFMRADMSNWSSVDAVVSAHRGEPGPAVDVSEVAVMDLPPASRGVVSRTYRERTWEIRSGTGLNPPPLEISFPYPVVLLSAEISVLNDMVGDSVRLSLHPFSATDDKCGVLLEGCVASVDFIEADLAPEKGAVSKGFRCMLADGSSFVDDLGECVRRDGTRIQVETVPHGRPAGTSVLSYYDLVPHCAFSMGNYHMDFAACKPYGIFINKGWKLKMHYLNSSLTDKRVVILGRYYI